MTHGAPRGCSRSAETRADGGPAGIERRQCFALTRLTGSVSGASTSNTLPKVSKAATFLPAAAKPRPRSGSGDGDDRHVARQGRAVDEGVEGGSQAFEELLAVVRAVSHHVPVERLLAQLPRG